MKILLVDDDPLIRESILFLMESHFAATVVEAGSGNEAISALTQSGPFDLVISDYDMPDGNGGSVFKYLRDNKMNIPFILCTSHEIEFLPEFSGAPIFGYVQKPNLFQPLIQWVSKLSDSVPLDQKYMGVRVGLLFKMGGVPSDLFIRLGENKYVKVARAGDFFDQSQMDRYARKNVSTLYLSRDRAKDFLEKLVREVEAVQSVKNVGHKAILDLSKHLQETLMEFSQKIGFTDEIQALAKANVELALAVLRYQPKIHDLLKDIFTDTDSYLCVHSIAVANVACGIAHQLKRLAENNYHKLALAAFLHDLTVKNEKLLEIHSLKKNHKDTQLKEKFSSSDVDEYQNHPRLSAEIVSQFSEIPPDIDTIVLQHHERPDGSGFPMCVDHMKITPLSAIFIVAHDIVDSYWNDKANFSLEVYLNERRDDYSLGYFKKIASTLNRASASMGPVE